MRTEHDISLKPYNTFGIDVRARRMLVLDEGDEVPRLEQPYLVLGGGSDMLFTHDYDGTIVKLSTTHNSLSTTHAPLVRAWGGMVMDDLVQWTLDHGLYGLENLSAIPGTVGAAAVQNVGAYGAEAKDVIESVEAYDLEERRLCTFNGTECRFAYRDSLFKHTGTRYLILYVTFRLSDTFTPNLSYKALEGLPHATAQQLRDSITALRWQKLPRPEEHGSAGSFFKNPVVDNAACQRLKALYPDMPDAHPTTGGYKLSAGWLIDRAGWKGRNMGRAGVWPHNALVLYNNGGATGEEVMALAAAIQDNVRDKFGVSLTTEAIIV